QPGRVGGQRGALVGEPLQVDLGAVRGEGNTHSGEPTGSCNRTGRRRRPDGMHRITLPLLAAATLALAGCSSPATPAPGAPAPPAPPGRSWRPRTPRPSCSGSRPATAAPPRRSPPTPSAPTP